MKNLVAGSLKNSIHTRSSSLPQKDLIENLLGAIELGRGVGMFEVFLIELHFIFFVFY